MKRITNTETNRPGTLPPVANAGKSPKGLGRDAYEPLMQKRAQIPSASPIGMLAATLCPAVGLNAQRHQNKTK